MTTTLPVLAALLLTAPAWAQTGQSVTQPSANLNQSQTQSNQSQQPAQVTGGATAQGQQTTQPSANQNQSQTQQNQMQNSRTGGTGGFTGTGPSR